MPCANTICRPAITGLTPTGLIAGEGQQLFKQAPHGPPAQQSRSKRHPMSAVVEIFADTEHVNPEHVWGDEGPVND